MPHRVWSGRAQRQADRLGVAKLSRERDALEVVRVKGTRAGLVRERPYTVESRARALRARPLR